jgi:hypothetical protein
MPRVKKFEELPTWLRQRLAADWSSLYSPTHPVKGDPSIRDPEYRVYRIGDSGWWAVDAGTGGVSVARDGKSHAYDDLPDDSPVKALVDSEVRAVRDAEHIEQLFQMILSRSGMDPRDLGRIVDEARRPPHSRTDAALVEDLVGILYDGLRYGNWPSRSSDR